MVTSDEERRINYSSASPYESSVGFSRAVRLGRRILVSGSAPIGRDGKTVEGDAGVQTRRCLEIVREAVEGLGGHLPDVVRTRVYLTDAERWNQVAAVHGEFFGEIRPAATMVIVAGLLDPAWQVEVEAEAVLPPSVAPRPSVVVRPFTDADRGWVVERSEILFGHETVVSRGEVHRPAELPGLIAWRGGERVGLVTWKVRGDEFEIVTLDALEQWRGIGTALMRAAEDQARRAGARRIWLITTNDNVDALRFYQRRGYTICAIHVGAIEESRRLKPQIAQIGEYGIPIRDEVELEKFLHGSDE